MASWPSCDAWVRFATEPPDDSWLLRIHAQLGKCCRRICAAASQATFDNLNPNPKLFMSDLFYNYQLIPAGYIIGLVRPNFYQFLRFRLCSIPPFSSCFSGKTFLLGLRLLCETNPQWLLKPPVNLSSGKRNKICLPINAKHSKTHPKIEPPDIASFATYQYLTSRLKHGFKKSL